MTTDKFLQKVRQGWIDALGCQPHELEFVAASDPGTDTQMKERGFVLLTDIGYNGQPCYIWAQRAVRDRVYVDYPEDASIMDIIAWRERGGFTFQPPLIDDETRDRAYAKIQIRWGNRLERMPRLDKLQVVALLTYALAQADMTYGLGYDISCALDELKNACEWQRDAMEFLQLAANLPQSEYLSICESLINQLKGGVA